MNFTHDQDLTVGNSAMRRYKVSGEKMKVSCPKCTGTLIVFVEDTVSVCSIHNIIPSIK